MARFSHWGNELDYFKEWEGGRSYTFTVEAGQIFAKGDSDLNNEKIEWTIDRRLPAGVCNMAGEKIGELNVGDLVFEWHGEENAIQESPSGGLKLYITMYIPGQPVSPPYMWIERIYKCKIESDTVNHIYKVIPVINQNIDHDPYVLYLLEGVTYELRIRGVSSIKDSKIAAIPTSGYIEGSCPYDSDCYEPIYAEYGTYTVVQYQDVEYPCIRTIRVGFNVNITQFDSYFTQFDVYVNGEPFRVKTFWWGQNKYMEAPYGLGIDGEIEYKESSVYELEIPSGLICSGSGQMYYMKTTRVPLNFESGISSISSEDKRELPVYDLYGRKVEKPVPGNIYIQVGKKFVMR